MLHPKNCYVNEKWMLFRLNDAPLPAGEDGDFNYFVLMDAASCYILSTAIISANEVEPSLLAAKSMLKQGKACKNELPKELIIPNEQCANLLESEAKRQGIKIIRLPESELYVYTSDARKAFKEKFGESLKQ